MILDIRVIPARNRFIVLHNGINAVPALQNIQRTRQRIRIFLHAQGFHVMVRKCLILRHCIVQIAEPLNPQRRGLQIFDHIELLYERLFLFFLRIQFFSEHRYKAIQNSRVAVNHPIRAEGHAVCIMLRGADLLCPFLIAGRKAAIVAFMVQSICQNVAHALHTVLSDHLIDRTIAKIHPIIIIRNRFTDCLLALAVQPIGCAV